MIGSSNIVFVLSIAIAVFASSLFSKVERLDGKTSTGKAEIYANQGRRDSPEAPGAASERLRSLETRLRHRRELLDRVRQKYLKPPPGQHLVNSKGA